MAKYEPGVYEPPSDDIGVFDGGKDDLEEEGSRLPLLIVIALLVLAAFGGVVWLAYQRGVENGRAGSPQVIAAQNGPVRTAPENPGGKTPYQGLKIYEQPAPAASQSAPAGVVEESANEGQTEAAAPAAKASSPKTAGPAQAAKPKVAAPAPTTRQAAAKPAPAKIAKAAPVKAAPAPATSAPAKSAATGAYVLQIGSYKSEAIAKAAWAAYARKHAMVSGETPDIQRADLGAKGVWYRLRIGSFAGPGAAAAFCDKLKADGGGCFVAKR